MLGDVHANLSALEAVLADIDTRGVAAIWNVGDFVGYGAHPEEVVRLLRRRADVSIIGNYDRKVLSLPEKRDKWRRGKHPEKLRAFEYAWEQLSEDSKRYLGCLPAEVRLDSGGRSVLLVHGSPEADNEPLTAQTDEKRLAELASRADADVVVCGHAHQAMCRKVGGVVFVNTGSVGRPEGDDRRACYATMEVDTDRIDVEHHRVAYDVEEAVAAIRRSDQPETFARMVQTGEGFVEARRNHRRQRQDEALAAAIALARRCGYDRPHTEQVTRLSLELFDKLMEIHKFGDEERFLLHCGALLHDIGWCEGGKGHHKTALRLICNDDTIELDDRERKLVACVARYHRKAMPNDKHPCYADLDEPSRQLVWMLAGILRVADGLDYTHGSVVGDLAVRVKGQTLEIIARCRSDAVGELASAERKSNVLANATGMQVVIDAMLVGRSRDAGV